MLSFHRSTYDILSWLGDVGGLADALLRLVQFILMSFTTFNVKSFLLTYLFRMPNHENKTEEKYKTSESRLSQIVRRQSTMSKIFRPDKINDGKTSKEIQYDQMLEQLTSNMKFIEPITYFQSIVYSIFCCRIFGNGNNRL